ncbi:hypothetical protein TNCV_1218391 [Trichonephila clavipes]|nr:hypothetical protein TNCV_1218391 [Trichonephila clavipes]
MGLSQADAARRLNSVVQRLWDQYQSEDSVSRRPVSYNICVCVADHFQASGRRISATTVRNMQVCMQEDQLRAFPSTDSRRNRLCWAREHVS